MFIEITETGKYWTLRVERTAYLPPWNLCMHTGRDDYRVIASSEGIEYPEYCRIRDESD